MGDHELPVDRAQVSPFLRDEHVARRRRPGREVTRGHVTEVVGLARALIGQQRQRDPTRREVAVVAEHAQGLVEVCVREDVLLGGRGRAPCRALRVRRVGDHRIRRRGRVLIEDGPLLGAELVDVGIDPLDHVRGLGHLAHLARLRLHARQVGDLRVERRQRRLQREIAVVGEQQGLAAAQLLDARLAQALLLALQSDGDVVVLKGLLALIARAQAGVLATDDGLRALLRPRGGAPTRVAGRGHWDQRERDQSRDAEDPDTPTPPPRRDDHGREPIRSAHADARGKTTDRSASGRSGGAGARADEIHDLAHDPVDVEVLRREDGGDPGLAQLRCVRRGDDPADDDGRVDFVLAQ